MKRGAFLQPNFFPWIGYFEIIKFVDFFLILDDVQYTKRDWRNRNYINFNGKKIDITVPVKTKNRYLQKINETEINDNQWLNEIYKKLKYYEEISEFLKNILIKTQGEKKLFNLTYLSIFEIMKYLNINKNISLSSNFIVNDKKKNERIIELCKKLEITNYITGPSALSYLKPNIFKEYGINLEIIKYKKQINYINDNNFKFLEKMSIIDLLFHKGSNSKDFLQDLDFQTL